MPTQTLKYRTLHCQLGDHDWQRTSQKGRLPINCPEHQPVVETTDKESPQERGQRVSRAARAATIKEILDTSPKCYCKITPEMTDDELMKEEINCNPYYVCSTLDKVRRHVVNYSRHFQSFDDQFEDELLEVATA